MKNSQKIFLFAFLSFIAFLWMALENYEEIKHEIGIFFIYTAAIVLLQALIVLGTGFLRHLPSVLAGFFTAINIHTMILVNTESLAGVGNGTAAVIILVLTAVFSGLYGTLKPKSYMIASRFLMVLASIIGFQLFLGAAWHSSLRPLPDHFTIPEFAQKPNVYVVTFDAMTPEEVTEDVLDLSGVSYKDEIRKYGGRIIPNTFAEQISTKWSLNAFLAMDMDYFNSFEKKNVFINDKAANPVYEIFRRNGYKVQFLYDTYYFGDDHGRLDYYGAAKIQGLCAHIEKPYAFLGYCFKPVQAAVQEFTDIRNEDFMDYFISRIKATAVSGEKWYTQTHIYIPGHTKLSFDPYKKEDWSEFRDYFKTRSLTAAEYLERILQTLKENDPDAILIVFGDHGPLTSRGLLGPESIDHYALDYTAEKVPADSPLTYKQIVQERHGVFFAVFPGDFCREGFRNNPISTVRIMRDTMKCLANGTDPLPADFQPHDEHWKPFRYQ